MKARERVLSAIQLEEPDQVPHFEMGVCHEILGEIFGQYPGFFEERSKTIQAYINLGIDGSMMEFGDMWGYGVPTMVMSEELFVDGMGNMFSYSMRTRTSYKGAFYVGGYLSTPEKYEKFHKEFPRPEPSDWHHKSIPAYREALKVAGDDFFVVPVTGGIFEESITPIGHADFFRYIYTNPRFIHRVLKYEKDRTIELTKIYADESAEIVALEDDYSDKHGPQITPKHWMQFVFPHLKEIADVCHKKGTFLMLHSCGNVEPLMPYIIEAGVDAIQSLEPTAGISLGRVKESYGDKICLVGNMDLNTLGLGTRDEVAKLARESIFAAAPSGGYMLGATHGIYPLTDNVHKLSKNFIALKEAIERYGGYAFSRSGL